MSGPAELMDQAKAFRLSEYFEAFADDWKLDRKRLEEAEKREGRLERIRSAAQAYVNAPTKFGIRHKAYRSLVKTLDEETP